MKTDPTRDHQLGTLLIWLGVLSWVPFVILQIIGKPQSFLWFLPFHLLGVIGGSRLRASARKAMDISPAQRRPLQILGTAMIGLGILTWAPYFYLKIVAQVSVDVMDFLPFHLSGVLGGSGLLVINRWMMRRKSGEKNG